MDSNRIVDDKFQSGQAYSVVRDEGEMECIIWIPHIHHDLCVRLLQMRHIEPPHLEIEKVFVNQARLPFGTTDRGTPVIFQDLPPISSPHHTWNAQFPADDGRMASPPSSIGHDSRSDLHDGFPVRVRHLGHQYLTFLKPLYLPCAGNDIDWPRSNLFTDALHLNQNPPLFLQNIGLQNVHFSLRFYCLRPCLKDKEFLGDTILSPLNISGHVRTCPFRIMVFDFRPPLSKKAAFLI